MRKVTRLSIVAFVLFGCVLFGLKNVVITAPVGPVQKAVLEDDPGILIAEEFVLGLENPWGMVFLPDGDLLVTEIAGTIRVIRNGKLLSESITGVPKVFRNGQGGLLDIEKHPQFESNRFIYLTLASEHGGSGRGSTALVRAKLNGMRLEEHSVLYQAEPTSSSGVHFGSRIEFGADGYLYFSVGDRGDLDGNPQALDRDGGKIYRLHDDGRIPADNPFVTQNGVRTAIFSYGHRNPQGLALNPTSQELWSHEHGPRGGDELNIIRAGRNYGWPVISYGINYSGTVLTELTSAEGMEQPQTYWTPSIAPCGMTFIKGTRYPDWKGDLIVGSLKFGYLVRVELDGDTVVRQQKIATGIGRVRNVEQGPDGLLYVGVEGKGIYRLMPK